MTPADPPIDVLIAEDHPLVVHGLGRLVDASPTFRLVGTAGTVADLRRMWQQLEPGMVVADIDLPDGSGLVVAEELLPRHPATRVVFYSGAAGAAASATVNRAVRCGAQGVLSKQGDPARLLDHLHRAVSGEFVLDEHTAALVAAHVGSPGGEYLTERETEVVRLVACGLTNAAIASRLGVSPNTVKTLLSRVRSKLDAADRASVVNLAIREGHIRPQ